MLKICLVFWKSEPQYANTRYAYKKTFSAYRFGLKSPILAENWLSAWSWISRTLKFRFHILVFSGPSGNIIDDIDYESGFIVYFQKYNRPQAAHFSQQML